jgi:hypothetical protein
MNNPRNAENSDACRNNRGNAWKLVENEIHLCSKVWNKLKMVYRYSRIYRNPGNLELLKHEK